MPAQALIAVSDSIADIVSHRHSKTIYNGVDTAVFTPLGRTDHEVPLVIFAGLLTRRKGVVDLIEASSALLERGIDHRLVLVGGRPDEGDEEEQRVRDSARGHEEFTGAVPHDGMPGLFRDADVFCLPSWWEAMPLSILEAMSSGLPVVATAVGQVPNIVTPDVGRLVEPKQPQALADALAELLLDRDLRRSLGATGRERVLAEYAVSSTVHSIVDVFQDVSSNRLARS
jgi:glycosyltransferase involved in cell wall biosynthesis